MIARTLYTYAHRAVSIILMTLTALTVTSCVDVEEQDNTAQGNLEALWKIMDERYCFFAEKEAKLGVNWDDVHTRYAAQVKDNKLSTYQLFELLCNMIGELRDGHVNLSASFDYGRNWSWKEDYPTNFSDTLQRNYLGTDYRIACGLKYRILDDNTGYIYCSTFENTIGDGNLDEILYYLMPCDRLIIDVRGNGGGQLTEAQRLAARFTDAKVLVGYMQHKTGTGHNDFSDREEQWIAPSTGVRWHKDVRVLTNRSVFSAANEFVKYMRCMPNVKVVGDTTGGGAGMPYVAELPNGWTVRFSACPMFDAQGNSTEQGIAPDVKVDITDEDFAKGLDTIIETARNL